MNIFKRVAVAVVLAAGAAGIAVAHHAVNSQFNFTKNLSFTGVMEKYYLGNPHTYVYFVRTVDGQSQHWAFETVAPLALRRAGLLAREVWKVGDTYTLAYSPSLDGSYSGLMNGMTLKDGRFVAFSAQNNIDAAKVLLSKPQ
jgi:hypothetical protein